MVFAEILGRQNYALYQLGSRTVFKIIVHGFQPDQIEIRPDEEKRKRDEEGFDEAGSSCR